MKESEVGWVRKASKVMLDLWDQWERAGSLVLMVSLHLVGTVDSLVRKVKKETKGISDFRDQWDFQDFLDRMDNFQLLDFQVFQDFQALVLLDFQDIVVETLTLLRYTTA